MPGCTHLQIAQPVTFGHHLMAYVEMFLRDIQRVRQARERLNELPLGAAALAGTSFPIDRHFVAERLGFAEVCQNSLDAVSDRDFVIDACSAGAQIMMHLSRLSEELVFWSNPLIGFIEIGDRFCTGSSIMPQKKNPDIPELARGKAGRVFGNLASVLAVMKSQPLAYNKDNQESKQPLVDTLETVRSSVRVFSRLLPSLGVNQESMRAAASAGFSTATDLADYLVRRGLPFREAHEVVALTVRRCIESGKDLSQLTLEELRQFSPIIEADVFQSVTLEGSVLARNHVGGTAPAAVTSAIESARQRVAAA
jgi:argininosuccinate lyase